MRLGACVCGTDVHWRAAARRRRGRHVGPLVVLWGSLGINDEELLGPSHVTDRVTEVQVRVPGDHLQVDLLQDFSRDCSFEQVPGVLIQAATLHLEGLELGQEFVNPLAWSLPQPK